MSVLFPGPYILDHVIRTDGERGFGVLEPSWLRPLGSEATYLNPARRGHKLFPARINSPHLAAGDAEYAGLAKYLKDTWGYNR